MNHTHRVAIAAVAIVCGFALFGGVESGRASHANTLCQTISANYSNNGEVIMAFKMINWSYWNSPLHYIARRYSSGYVVTFYQYTVGGETTTTTPDGFDL